MERLIKFTYVLGGILIAVGIWAAVSSRPSYEPKTEKWMEEKSLTKLGEYAYVPSGENPSQSYSMGEFVRNELMPYGIVCRVFRNHNLMVDVVLIASGNKASFHDPKVCFTAQGWNVVEDEKIEIDTPRGKIPASYVKVVRQGEQSIGIYFYRGPGGFAADSMGMKFGMFWERFFGGKDADGVFYRFMPMGPGMDREDLKKFISDYMVESEKVSGGYF